MTNIELENFIKAVWAAGFRSGYDNGGSNACAYEHGSYCDRPCTAIEAWKEDLGWVTREDKLNIKFWEDQ